ncbi:C-C motif chemokine 26 [Tupaia chinensis]|uniref:C-C motif chemokine n=2 Tax=Tupaia chinensis TaxID=246437 RepID=L9K192_TUPCH|nr:C-C motif chemokine 26 [Tupaia chinensis]
MILPVLLAVMLSIHLGAPTRGSDMAKSCCFHYNQKMLPFRWVHTYEFTRNSCPKQGVIFTTKRGKQVCVQPKEKWVQTYIALLRAQKQL